MSELKVIDVYGAGEHVVVARDAEDARALMLGLVDAEDLTDAVFKVYPDDAPFKVWRDEDEEPVTKTCAEWARYHGRGHFSTSYT